MTITSLNRSPYFDDYNTPDQLSDNKTVREKGYYRILFQPTYAVQTRELNQLQTMLQDQIGILGESQINSFQGGKVLNGEVQFQDNVNFLDITFSNQDVQQQIPFIKYIESRVETSPDVYEPDLKAEVFSIDAKEGGEYRVWFKYLNTGSSNKTRFVTGEKLFLREDKIPFSRNFAEDSGDWETINIGESTDPLDYSFADAVNDSGYGFSISVKPGVYFVKSSFVHTPEQTKFFVKPSKIKTLNGFISFIITETVTSAEEDETLKDNANGSYNYAAPGADRYTIKLDLSVNTEDADILNANAGNSFIFNSNSGESLSFDFLNVREILRSKFKDLPTPQDVSEQVEEFAAQRTFDESGNYTIRPFVTTSREFLNKNNGGRYTIEYILENNPFKIKDKYFEETSIDIRNYRSSDKDELAVVEFEKYLKERLILDVEPSVAYINGKRVGFTATRSVPMKKSRTTRSLEEVDFVLSRGNYIDVVFDPDLTSTTEINDLFNFSNLGKRIRNIEYLGQIGPGDPSFLADTDPTDPYLEASIYERQNWLKYRLYVYNDFNNRSTTDRETSPDMPNNFEYRYLPGSLTGGSPIYDAKLKQSAINSSIFYLPYKAVKEVSQIDYIVQDNFTATAGASSITFSIGAELFKTFATGNILDIIVYNARNDKYLKPDEEFENFVNNETQLTLNLASSTTISQGDSIQIITSCKINGANRYRSKTVASKEDQIIADSTSSRNGSIVVVPDQDVILQTLVVCDCVTNETIPYSIVDSGSGNNFYDNPVIKLSVNPPNDVSLSYNYFEHGTGDYFSVNSYTKTGSTILLEDVPRFQNSRLSDYIDFRTKRERIIDSNSTTGYSYTLVEEPIRFTPNSILECDMVHYLPRIDRLLIDDKSNLWVLGGKPEVKPYPPRTPDNTMTLYEIFVNPYTYDSKDMIKKYVDNNRYTMKDIGKLEKRIRNLEYYSTLSLLEKESKDRKILDISEENEGVERFKNGLLVDSFLGHNVGDVANKDYSVAVNKTSKTMGPSFKVNNFRLKYTGLVNKDIEEQNFNVQLNMSDAQNDPDSIVYNKSGSVIDGIIETQPITDQTPPGYAGREQITLDEGVREIMYENLNASQTYSVQPFEVTKYIGTMQVSPSSDEWIDTERLPTNVVEFSPIQGIIDGLAEAVVDAYGTNETLLETILVGTETTVDSNTTFMQSSDSAFASSTDTFSANTSETASSRDRTNASAWTAAGHGGVTTNATATSDVTVNASAEVVVGASAQAFANGEVSLQTTQTTTTVTNTYQDTYSQEWLSLGSDVDSISIDFGERQVDTSVIPWIRSRRIMFRATGLKPNTKLYAFFDKQDVTDYVAGTATYTPYSYSSDVVVYNGEAAPFAGNDLVTDEFGTVNGVFQIPNNSQYAFRTGLREFKLTDNPFNNSLESDTYAIASYYANGLVQTKERSVTSVRPPEFIKLSSTSSSQWSETTSETDFSIDELDFEIDVGVDIDVDGDIALDLDVDNNINVGLRQSYSDPVAQTFKIGNDFPVGSFITDVDLFIAEAPEDPNVPITAYIVTTSDGYPTTTVVPGASKTLLRNQITRVSGRYVGENGEPDFGQSNEDPITNYPTRFTFDYPVYLEAKTEYALIVFSPSPEFRIWTSVLGQTDLNTNRTIVKNPDLGVFLQSQNKRTWSADQYRDIMIRMHKAVFPVSQTVEYKFSTLIPSNGVYPAVPTSAGGNTQGVENFKHSFHELFMKTVNFPFAKSEFEVDYYNASGNRITPESFYRVINAGQQIPFRSEISTASFVETTARLITLNRDVTPVVDVETGSIITREYNINDDITGEGATLTFDTDTDSYIWENPSAEGGNALSRYITKRVVLNNPSDELRVTLAVNRPALESNIKLFAKRKPAEQYEASLRTEVDWYEMSIHSVGGNPNNKTIPPASNTSDFVEVEYVLPNPSPNFIDTALIETGYTHKGPYDVTDTSTTYFYKDVVSWNGLLYYVSDETLVDPSGFTNTGSDTPTTATSDWSEYVIGGFTEFTVKTVFTSTDNAKFCKIADFRAFATV